jgi:hypothetical protein
MKTEDVLLAATVLLLVAILIHRHWGFRASDEPGLGLSDFIVEVKKGIIEASKSDEVKNGLTTKASKSEDAEIGFRVITMDLELNCVVRKGQTNSGEARIFAITAGSQSQISSEEIQKVTLHLTADPDKHLVERRQSQSSATTGGSKTYTYSPQENTQ